MAENKFPGRIAIVLICALTVSLFHAEARAQTASQGSVIEAIRPVVEQAAAIMRDRNISITDRRRQLHDLVLKYFDFRYMARSSLGSHWKELSPEQREAFTQAFAGYIESSYLSRIKSFAKFEYHFIREQTESPGYSRIFAEVRQPGHNPVNLDVSVRQEDGVWKAYDVTVDNISIVSNYRNQFSRVINRDGFDALLAQLKQKQNELESLLNAG